jgi:hypothetical protein
VIDPDDFVLRKTKTSKPVLIRPTEGYDESDRVNALELLDLTIVNFSRNVWAPSCGRSAPSRFIGEY